MNRPRLVFFSGYGIVFLFLLIVLTLYISTFINRCTEEDAAAKEKSEVPSIYDDVSPSDQTLNWGVVHTSGDTTYIPINRLWLDNRNYSPTGKPQSKVLNLHATYAAQKIISDFFEMHSELEMIGSPVFFIEDEHLGNAETCPILHGILLSHRPKQK